MRRLSLRRSQLTQAHTAHTSSPADTTRICGKKSSTQWSRMHLLALFLLHFVILVHFTYIACTRAVVRLQHLFFLLVASAKAVRDTLTSLHLIPTISCY